ncbi:helix-turn-helix domain-containing protein [Lacticaseibacillus suihuaensis]
MAQLSYSAYLEATRVDHHISVKTLCQYIGFSPTTYRRILRGEVSPKVSEFCRWIDFMFLAPGSAIGEALEKDYFRLTGVENHALKRLRDPAPLADAEPLRESLLAMAVQTQQSDYRLLAMLVDLRRAAPAARPAIARRVVAALRQRQQWSRFELQCFVIAAPALSWPIVSHCMSRYVSGGAAGTAVRETAFGNQEPLLIAYATAAAKTHICENVAQVCRWYGETFNDADRRFYDGWVIAAIAKELRSLFERPQVASTDIEAVFAPRLAILTAWQDDAPHRLTGRLQTWLQGLLAGCPYHHDRRRREQVVVAPVHSQHVANFGLRFARLRRAKGVSVKDLCRLSGLSRGVYRRFCDGSDTLRLNQLCRLLDCCHIGVGEFLTVRDLPGTTTIQTMVQTHITRRAAGQLTATDLAETAQVHELALAAGSPFFLNMWRLIRAIDVEGTADNSSTMPIVKAMVALLMTYDNWNYQDYVLYGDVGGYADMQSARLVMQRLVKAIATASPVIARIPVQTYVTLWMNLLLVAYRTHEVAAVLTVTDTIQGLATPRRGGADTLAWSILRRYAQYVAAVVTTGPTQASPAWLRLNHQAKTLMPDTKQFLMAIFGGNQELLMASDLWPAACEAGNPPQEVAADAREFMGTAPKSQPR